MRRLVAGEIRAFTMEKRYRHKDGHFVWVNLTVSPLWAPGEPPSCHLAMVEDSAQAGGSIAPSASR
jgi:PAS domain S-box-containing protein